MLDMTRRRDAGRPAGRSHSWSSPKGHPPPVPARTNFARGYGPNLRTRVPATPAATLSGGYPILTIRVCATEHAPHG